MSTTTTTTLTNGEVHKSGFISHITSYPVVSDGIETFKSNPYGAKSIEVADATYIKFGKPIEPYLKTPYSYAKPYVQRADSLADKSLDRVDARFPIVKENTNTIVEKFKGYVYFPLSFVDRGYSYVVHTYNDEHEKTVNGSNRKPGIVTSLMAMFSTELKIASDTLEVAASFLYAKKEEAKQKKDGFVKAASDKKDEYTKYAQDKAEGYTTQFKQGFDGYLSKSKQAASETTGQDGNL